ncbi:MAG: hypothetical protein IV086_13870 [Hyphomonadaceae bacterium]|nr:MAG: hypothetical protein FD160_3300 [Caulobacteraceae bacterium]MBT9446784.1 hypothetical protein [Hyphomonadaceae bacterium]TPW04356.1 MAG: hypothetical protein FD124_2649 [Alphaproteobacteria bacterium]
MSVVLEPGTRSHATLSARLNAECFCTGLDEPAFKAALAREIDGEADLSALMEARPHLVSQAPVFIERSDGVEMLDIVAAIEAASRMQGYMEIASAWTPEIARRAFGPRGAMMGYDFHLTPDGPKLIEINTNAGGAFLNAVIARAQSACCREVEEALASTRGADFETLVVDMFEREWRAQRGAGRPGRIAIVDDAPEAQYLYPEFLLARRMLMRCGFETVIADAASLRYEGDALLADGRPVDLVYNRLTDFAFDAPAHAALRAAYADGAVVVTPNPHVHALLADKRNLALLCSDRPGTWGLDRAHLASLARIPQATPVTAGNADALWKGRKGFFFKPSGGYGGKAVYRGDKLTKGVWDAILADDYIAQALVTPSERMIRLDGAPHARKLDVRLYTYDGALLLAAARLYQGQTTNFRTPGGGFAPVYLV